MARSAAELFHGSLSIASPELPAMVMAAGRHSRESVGGAIASLQAAGASVLVLAPGSEPVFGACMMPVPEAGHEWLQPLVSLFALYPALVQLARQQGRDPDRPPHHLEKLTRTR